MQQSAVNPEQPTEVVYFHEVARDPRFDDLHARLKKLERIPVLTQAPGAAREESKLKQISHWWPLPALLVAIIVFLFGPGIVSNYFSFFVNDHIDKKLDQPIKDLHQLQIDVAKIGVRLELREKASLTPLDFKGTLPDLSTTLKKAADFGVRPSPDVSAAIQRNLRSTDNSAPGYWQATSQFISFQSAQESGLSLGSQLPPCYNNPPALIGTPGQSFYIWSKPLEWMGCVFDLEQEMPEKYWDSIAGNKLYREKLPQLHATGPVVLLRDCVIRYSGGKIPDRIYKLLGFASFQNCLLEFDFQKAPPREGQRISEVILASTSLKDVDLRTLQQ